METPVIDHLLGSEHRVLNFTMISRANLAAHRTALRHRLAELREEILDTQAALVRLQTELSVTGAELAGLDKALGPKDQP